jgi:hypothetical protein
MDGVLIFFTLHPRDFPATSIILLCVHLSSSRTGLGGNLFAAGFALADVIDTSCLNLL